MVLPVNSSTHLILAYYSSIDPERMTGWVGLVGWPVADGLPTLVVTHQLHRRSTTVPRHQPCWQQPPAKYHSSLERSHSRSHRPLWNTFSSCDYGFDLRTWYDQVQDYYFHHSWTNNTSKQCNIYIYHRQCKDIPANEITAIKVHSIKKRLPEHIHSGPTTLLGQHNWSIITRSTQIAVNA